MARCRYVKFSRIRHMAWCLTSIFFTTILVPSFLFLFLFFPTIDSEKESNAVSIAVPCIILFVDTIRQRGKQEDIYICMS